ncbi:MAG: hypothetical protein LUE27_04820 [Clostridia bacterium]|nr:hypothetical protein [Clostridia bacterium]
MRKDDVKKSQNKFQYRTPGAFERITQISQTFKEMGKIIADNAKSLTGESLLPPELRTDKARNVLKRAVDQHFLDDDGSSYSYNKEKTKIKTKTQLAYFCWCFGKYLDLAKHKFWRPFEELFNKGSKTPLRNLLPYIKKEKNNREVYTSTIDAFFTLVKADDKSASR